MKWRLYVSVLFTAVAVGCSDSPTAVVTWQLTGPSTQPTVLVGDQTTLTVEEIHDGVHRTVPNSELTWRIVSGDAITVSGGVIVSIQPGTSVVEAKRGTETVTFSVTVAPRPITSIHLVAPTTLIRKDTATTSVTGIDDHGTTREMTTVQLLSRSPQILQVTADGRLVAVETGSAVVVAAYGALLDSTTVQVGVGAVDQLGMQFTTSVAAGDSVFVTFSPLDSHGNPLNNISITMSSGNALVADLRATTLLSQSGVWIKSKSPGVSNIHASSGLANSATILNVGPPRVIAVQAILSNQFFFWQDSVTASVIGNYSDGTSALLTSGVTWSVVAGSDKFAVTVDQVKTVGPSISGGVRRDVGAAAVLRASFGPLAADVNVSAGSQRPTSVVIAGPDAATTGSTITLTVAYFDSVGRALPANRIVGTPSWALPTGAVAAGNNQWQMTVTGSAIFVALYVEPGVTLVTANKSVIVSDVVITPPPPPPPPPPSGYVELEFLGSASPTITAAFTAAQNRINSIISLSNAIPIAMTVGAGVCANPSAGLPTPAFSGTVQGVKIYAQVATIDGVGNILGQAGPCFIRSAGSHFPVMGSMMFDVADLNNMASNGTLAPVILHEMMHIMGIGTIWSYSSFFVGNGGPDPRWTGPTAKAQYQLLGAADFASGVPIENTGGGGTAYAHWRELTFGTELMTGWINGSVAPLSKMTIASLADQGYQVSYAAADPYALGGGLIAGMIAGSGVNIGAGELVELPRFLVSPFGKLAAIAGAPAWRDVIKP